MMGMGLVATGLVSAALDRGSDEGVQRAWMRGCVQVLALFVPVLGGLAIAAVGVRVGQYGWTPDRLAAATIAVVVFAYGVVYAGSILMRGDWGHRLRLGNIVMAVGVFVLMALWLTPVMNPQAVSTRSQIARFDAGQDLASLPLYEMAHDWGTSGARGLTGLKARLAAKEDTDLVQLIEAAQIAKNRYSFERDNRHTNQSVLISVPALDGQQAHLVAFTRLDRAGSTVWFFKKDSATTARYSRRDVVMTDQAKIDVLAGKYQLGRPKFQTVQIEGAEIIEAPWN